MPIIDMPIEELKTYKGVNPKPKDFNKYWDTALKEMESVDTDVSLIRSSFKVPFADCFDLYFTGVRGARIHAKYIRPKMQTQPHPAVLQFHGYGGNSGDWNDKLNFAAAGLSVAAMDCRGQGGISEDLGGISGNTLKGHIIRGLNDSPDNLLYRHIFLDTVQLASIIMSMPEVDENRVGAMGASQGGALTLACAALEPRIKRLAPQYPFLCDYKRVWDLDLTRDAYQELQEFFRFYDPKHEREQEVFTNLGYIDIQNLTERIRGEVLFAVGLMDTVCPPSTQFAAYNKIISSKSMKIYPDFGHESMPEFNDDAFMFMLGL